QIVVVQIPLAGPVAGRAGKVQAVEIANAGGPGPVGKTLDEPAVADGQRALADPADIQLSRPRNARDADETTQPVGERRDAAGLCEVAVVVDHLQRRERSAAEVVGAARLGYEADSDGFSGGVASAGL